MCLICMEEKFTSENIRLKNKLKAQCHSLSNYSYKEKIEKLRCQKKIPYIIKDYKDKLNIYEYPTEKVKTDIDWLHNLKEEVKYPINKQFSKFIFNGKEYILKTPIEITINYEHGYWSYENEEYTLDVCEKSQKEADITLNEQFANICNTFLDKKDNELTKGARRLRDLIKENLKEIRLIDGQL